MDFTTIEQAFVEAAENIEENVGSYSAQVVFNEDDAQENEENVYAAFDRIDTYDYIFKEKGFTIEKGWREGYTIDLELKPLVDEWFDSLSYADKCVALFLCADDTFTPEELKKQYTPEEMLRDTFGETELIPEWWYDTPLEDKQFAYGLMNK